MKNVIFGLFMFISISAHAADFTVEMNGKRPGEVFSFSGSACPPNSLLANGAAVSKTGQYAALFSAIGTAHGDAGANFNIPDYRGRFLRMIDSGANRDPDKSSRSSMNAGGNSGDQVGSVQNHIFGFHNHIQDAHSHPTWIYSPGYGGPDGAYMGPGAFQSGAMNVPVTATNQGAGGNETRPINASVIFCVAY